MIRKFLLPGLLFILTFLTGCGSQTAQSDNEKLMLIKELPFGVTYQEVKQKFPDVGPNKPEGYPEVEIDEGLTEATVSVNVLGYKAELEFNFEDNKLYRYGFAVEFKNKAGAENLYTKLQEFYTQEFGAYLVEKQAEGDNLTISNFWYESDFELCLVHHKNWDGRHFVNWGFQHSTLNY
ncbi:MAG: hypothetical protein FH756_02165 [Firmicutes bacterium]|nr:hypothetical protein [Bacillota bacterium]